MTSSDTPPKLVPSFDHLVTQWMSHGIVSNGSASNCALVHSRSAPTMPSILNSQSAQSTRGVGPTVRTGKPGSKYWPGGIRSASSAGGRRGPGKPRDMKLEATLNKLRRRSNRYVAQMRISAVLSAVVLVVAGCGGGDGDKKAAA